MCAYVRAMEIRFLCLTLVGMVLAAQDTGRPAGFIADCPGMNRTTKFSDYTKSTLSMVVMWPAQNFFGSSEKRCPLSDKGVTCVAKALNFKKRKTQVMISGYLDASFSPLVRLVSNAYLERGRNVIVLEIFPILVRTYPIAARITRPLGKLMGSFLAELTRRGLSPHRLELVGGSLGAHIASYAAVRFRQLTGHRPARLTGLDPAGPCFRNLPPSERFNADAAVHVDALHTNIDGFGIADAVAQVDFYANGGEYQPATLGNLVLPCFLVCSHVRSAFYWVSSIRYPEKFAADRCDSVARARQGHCYERIQNLLGPKTNFSRPGIYYLPTTDFPPFYSDNRLSKRSYHYSANSYLLQASPDKDIVV